MRDFTELLGQLQAESGLVVGYFAGFSRFEYALIGSGFTLNIGQGNAHHAIADWIAFTTALEPNFNCLRTRELEDAVAYLESSPPRRLGIVNGALQWVRNTDADNKTRLGALAVHVKTVRNNLFHGGKFANGPPNPAERDNVLLRSGIVMIDEFLTQSASDIPRVTELFEPPAIQLG